LSITGGALSSTGGIGGGILDLLGGVVGTLVSIKGDLRDGALAGRGGRTGGFGESPSLYPDAL